MQKAREGSFPSRSEGLKESARRESFRDLRFGSEKEAKIFS